MSVDGRWVAGRFDRALVRSRGRSGASLAEMCFPDRAESVGLVRRFVGVVTEAYGVGHVGETAALLVSELATNASQHAQDSAWGWFEVVVSRRADRLRVEVRDGSPILPVMRYFAPMDENGRGLFLIGAMAASSGTYRLPRGKAVWFELIAWDDPNGGWVVRDLVR